tara:strand:+ start:197 stop:1063 length:867 start_codon:yes stop_codon:yes gene_type:complete
MNFYKPNNSQFYRGGVTAVDFYNDNCLRRRGMYEYVIKDEYKKIADEVKNNGHSKIENFFDLNMLDKFKSEVATYFDEKINTRLVQNDNHVQINEPYLNTKMAFDIATDDRIVNIASAFFNCLPGLGTCNLRKSFVTHNPPSGTNMFHKDFNSPVKILKFFVYLNDVGLKNGPFTYVEGSNRELPINPHWFKYHRWPDSEIEKVYGKDRIKHLTANYGDLLIATTNGFHKGLKIEEGERTMFTINFLIHPEIEGGDVRTAKNRFYVEQSRVDSLPAWKRPLADFLIKV